MGAVYSAILSKMEKQGWAPPRTRAKIGKAELSDDRAAARALRDDDAAYVIGAGLAGLSAAVALAGDGMRVEVIEAARAGRRALPLLFRCRARHDHRQRQSSGSLGQPCDDALSARHRRANTRSPGPDKRERQFRRSDDGRALDDQAQRRRHSLLAVRQGRARSRARSTLDYLGTRQAAHGAAATRRVGDVSCPAEGALWDRLLRAVLPRGAQHQARDRLCRACGAIGARDIRERRPCLPSAHRPSDARGGIHRTGGRISFRQRRERAAR